MEIHSLHTKFKNQSWAMWLGIAVLSAMLMVGACTPPDEPGDPGTPPTDRSTAMLADPATTTDCPDSGSGWIIHVGIDTNGNGTLDAGEYDPADDVVICDGAQGPQGDPGATTWVEITSIAAGGACGGYTGHLVTVFWDLNANQTYDPVTETTMSSTSFCDDGAGIGMGAPGTPKAIPLKASLTGGPPAHDDPMWIGSNSANGTSYYAMPGSTTVSGPYTIFVFGNESPLAVERYTNNTFSAVDTANPFGSRIVGMPLGFSMHTPEFLPANSTMYLTLTDTWNQANTYYFVGAFGADEGHWDVPFALGSLTTPYTRPSSTGDSDLVEGEGSHYGFQVPMGGVYSVRALNWTTMENDRGVRGKEMQVTDRNMVWERCIQPSRDAMGNPLENQNFGCLVDLPAATDIQVQLTDSWNSEGGNPGATFALSVSQGDSVTPTITPFDYTAFIADLQVNDPPTFSEEGRIEEGQRWMRLLDTATDVSGEVTVMFFNRWDLGPLNFTLYTSVADMLTYSNGRWCSGMCSFTSLAGNVYIEYGGGWSQDYALLAVGSSFQVGVTTPVPIPTDGSELITTAANNDEFGGERPSWYAFTMAANTSYTLTGNGDANLEMWDGARTGMIQSLGNCIASCTLDNSAVGTPTDIQIRAVPVNGSNGAVHRITITQL